MELRTVRNPVADKRNEIITLAFCDVMIEGSIV